ncbi:hypothetical protein [Kribbella sp. NPDC050470]|uniref:hypothetical protein n=1 Tax=unclassified Kribbella TaxID=2644121 RepID=UPI00378CEAD3
MTSPEGTEQALTALQEAMAPWRAGKLPPTGSSSWNTLHDSYSATELTRLRAIKQRVDPSGVLVGNYSLGVH